MTTIASYSGQITQPWASMSQQMGFAASDQELIEGIKRGEEAALGALYARYRSLAYATVLRITGDHSASSLALLL